LVPREHVARPPPVHRDPVVRLNVIDEPSALELAPDRFDHRLSECQLPTLVAEGPDVHEQLGPVHLPYAAPADAALLHRLEEEGQNPLDTVVVPGNQRQSEARLTPGTLDQPTLAESGTIQQMREAWVNACLAFDEFRAELCYLGHLNAIKEELTPLENLLASARLAEETLDEDAALDALERVGLAGRADLACRYLSQGQKRRVALARLVHEKRALWVLDEPYVALDTAAVDLIADLIGAHLERGGLAVLTTHQTVAVRAGAVRELRLG
ncbi:MAG: heme ABC exporter ATP-binding protein CcmA, partial [Proteobacteria bacterium]|nr:heme ABC exporter ATP-binding protein CcmA [Pseudomonadota bacterium]